MQTIKDERTIRVAIVQASPIPSDLAGSSAKAFVLIEEVPRTEHS